MKIQLRAMLYLVSALIMAAPHGVACADAQTYGSIKRQVKVGILVSSAVKFRGQGFENPDPHVFYVAERRTDLKPVGVEYVNPLAPPVITSAVYARWLLRSGAPVGNSNRDSAFNPSSPLFASFQVGSKVTKNMGAYWEVNLDDASQDNLQQFDVLYLHSHASRVQLTPDLREKLRKFVEGGGTLWVENCGNLSFDNRAPMLYDVNFHSGSNPTAGAVIAAPNHPIVSQPYVLSSADVQNMGDKRVNDFYLYRANPLDSTDTGPGPAGVNPPGQGALTPVVWNTRGSTASTPVNPGPAWRPYIAAGTLGSGRMIFSSQDTGCAINDYVSGDNQVGQGGNSGSISGERLSSAHPTDLKFLYNVTLWTSAHLSAQADARRTGNSTERIGTALTEKWRIPASGTGAVGGVAIYQHCAFLVDGNLVLHCFNLQPGEDLDGDGNPDDGLPDLIKGLPYDEIWRLDLKAIDGSATGSSTPVIAEIYDPSQTGGSGSIPSGLSIANLPYRQMVVVMLSTGRMVAVRALPRLNKPKFPLSSETLVEWATDAVADFTPGIGLINPPAPVLSEGVIFATIMTATGSRIIAVDPYTGAGAMDLANPPGPNNGAVPGVDGTPQINGFSVGYIRDEATGTLDKIVYGHVSRLVVGMSQSLPETIRAYPFGSKGEPLARQGNTNVFLSRSAGSVPASPWYIYDDAMPGTRNVRLRQRVYAVYRLGAAVDTMELSYDQGGTAANSYSYNYIINGGPRVTVIAQLNFPNAGNQLANSDNVTIYADFTLDWTNVAVKINARASLVAPDIAGQGNLLTGPPTLATDDHLYYSVDTTASSGTVPGRGVMFGLYEQGSRASSIRWTYMMHNGFDLVLEDGSTKTIPPRLRQVDPSFPALVGNYLTDVQFMFSPVVQGNVVYSVGRATINGAAASIICAFSANPDLKIRLGTAIDRNVGIRIRQMNPLTSINNTPTYVDIPPSLYTIDYNAGIIRFKSMGIVGSPDKFVATDLPFLIKIGNAPELVIAGTQIDSFKEARVVGPEGMDNLLWYAVLPSTAIAPGAPAAFGLISAPPILQDKVLWLAFSSGLIASLDADPGSVDPAAQPSGAQVTVLGTSGIGHLRWAAMVGDGSSPILASAAGSNGVLVANTASGARAFENSLTLIADGRRLLEVDGAGDPVWSCDGTRAYGVAGGELPLYVFDPGTGNVIPANPDQATGVVVVHKVPWSRPQVARRINVNDMVVVDTGNSRVVQIDRGGNVAWEISRVQDDFKILVRPGDPLTLNEPTDCLIWSEFVPSLSAWFASNGPGLSYADVPGFVFHYLIADTGNFRVLEVVDVFDAAGRVVTPNKGANPANFTMTRQLFFTTSTYSLEGKRYRYRALNRVVLRNGDLPAGWQDPAKAAGDAVRLTLGIIQNYRAIGSATVGGAVNTVGQTEESSGGSLVVLGENGAPLSVISNLRIPTGGTNFAIQPIVNPVWFAKVDDVVAGVLTFKYLLVDANGCYQLRPGTSASEMDVEWLLTNNDYYRMTGKRLNAVSIQRLTKTVLTGPNAGLHYFLITNRFSGEDNPSVFGISYTNNPASGNISGSGEFTGEVFELNPEAFNFADPISHGYLRDYISTSNVLKPNPVASIVWRSPKETVPQTGFVGRIRRSIGTIETGVWTSLLEQPAFADRPY